MSAFALRATILQTPESGRLDVRERVVVEVNETGDIAAVSDGASFDGEYADLGEDVVLLPGLVDTHIHAPQWPQLGTGLDLPLEQWLFEYTFPIEKRLTEPAFAAQVWPAMVQTLLAHGTTTAVYYATVDVETTTMLAGVCASEGQRAFVGRVAMDHPAGTPEWYRDPDPAAAIERSLASIGEVRALGSPLVEPIVTPRFAPACTDEVLRGLGELAAAHDVRVQTHCSESDWEHRYAFERFGVSDTTALDGFGLVRPHTVLAHGDHLSDDDFGVIAQRRAGVAHCPLSNAYFGNAVFPARRALDQGVMVGLGTDIAGGASPSLLAQCGYAVTASRYLEDGVDPALGPDERGVADSRVSITEAFHLATVGGAELLGLPVGLLAVGRPFDAIAVRLDRADSALQRWNDVDDWDRTFEKVVRLATPGDMDHVWVQGRRVAGHAAG